MYIKYNNNHAPAKIKIVTGIAKINQSANEISVISGKIILIIRANERFGGVPTSVAIPPIEAEYAIPRSNPIEYLPIFASPRLSSNFIIIDKAIGTIIIAVAVFDIHIDKNEVASIKPSNILPGLIPKKIRIFKHDVINAVNTVKTVYKLKRKGSIDTQKENWISVKKSIFMDKDLIRKNIAHFEAIEGNIIELLTEKAITGIKGNLSCSDDKYKTLLKHLARYSERNNEVVVYDADDIISLLNESVKILETVKV